MNNKTTPPPIQWLPVFESAARHLSFKDAAAELCVTPPAVSQQIKVLEDYLGVLLFDRRERRLRLTSEGEHYYKLARNVIGSFIKGHKAFERNIKHPIIRVSAPIFFAQELMIPNYASFYEACPATELRIITGNDFADFESDDFDAAIRFGAGPWPSLDCRLLSNVDIKLVCSQKYIDTNAIGKNTIISAEELQKHVLLSLYDDLKDWTQAFPELQPTKKIVCDSYFSVIKSAEEGLGIAPGLTPIINRLTSSGRLISLQSQPLHTEFSYWLVAPQNTENTSQIDALYRWTLSLFDSLT